MYHRWGTPKRFFGEGFYGMFSPPLSFPPHFVFSEESHEFESHDFRLRIANSVPIRSSDPCPGLRAPKSRIAVRKGF